MKAYSAENPEFLIADNYNDLAPFLECEQICYDIETFTPLENKVLTKRGKVSAKQPMDDPFHSSPRLHQFYSPGYKGLPVILDTKKFPEEDLIRFLKELFETGERRIYAHNAIFDGSFLYHNYGVLPLNLYCTKLMAQIYWAGLFKGLQTSEKTKNVFSLASVYLRIFGGKAVDKTLQASDWGLTKLSYDQLLYAAKDTIYGYMVGDWLHTAISNAGMYTVMQDEMKGLLAFITARCNGQVIDPGELQKLLDEYTETADRLKGVVGGMFRSPGMNPNSPKQVKEALVALGMNVQSTGSGVLSKLLEESEETEEEETEEDLSDLTIGLEDWQKKALEALMAYRSVVTGQRYLKSLQSVLDCSRGVPVAHGDFNVMATQGTGRSSCIAKGQRVAVPGGYKAIEDIQVGDWVYCLDNDAKPHLRKVLNTFVQGVKPVIKLHWKSTGSNRSGELICTPDHKIRIKDGSWVQAQDLPIGQSVWHLTRKLEASNRWQVYAPKSYRRWEQVLIKLDIFGGSEDDHIHHKDEDKSNNSLDNLEVLSKADHHSLHAKENVERGVIKWDHLEQYKGFTWLSGEDHPMYLKFRRFEFLRILAHAKGSPTKVHMDFETVKKKCAELQIDWREVKKRYNKSGQYLSRGFVLRCQEEVANTDLLPHDKLLLLQSKLQLGRVATIRLCEKYNLEYNHMITKIESFGEIETFDIEVEEFHNFITEEINTKNCRKPNLQNPARLGTLWSNLGLRAIRTCFRHPDPDWQIISLDSAGCHVQIARAYSRDQKLIEILEKGLDPYITLGVSILEISGVYMTHDEIKKIVKDKKHPRNYEFKEMRQLWKKVFLSRLNGAGARKIHGELLANDPPIRTFTLEDCKLACTAFDTTFWGLAKTQKDLVKEAMSRYQRSPFGCWENYTLTSNGKKHFFNTNEYALARSLDGGRYYLPMMYRSWDVEDLNEHSFKGAKPTEVLAFSWQRVEGSCVKKAAGDTVIWIHENNLQHLVWLGNINHDEMVLVAHKSVAVQVATQANQFIEDAFRRFVMDYTDRANVEDKIVRSWDLKD